MTIRRQISYVIPVFDEAANLDVLHETLDGVAAALADRYDVRFYYVNDGSRDDSLQRLEHIAARDSRVTVVDLARNFGHQIAVTAGLDVAEGDAVIVMDADMQDPPHVSLELIERWEAGYHVVYARRRTRQDSRFKVFTAHLFYRALRRMSDVDIPADVGDFRLLDRSVVQELRKFREHNRFLRGMVSYVGFKQTAVDFDRNGRHAGRTGYPLTRMLRLASDGLLGFSTAPLRFISRAGFLISALSLVAVCYVLAVKVFTPEDSVPGWAFLATGMFFLGGIQIVMLGVLGSYVGRIHTEVQNRPLYSVAAVQSGRARTNGHHHEKEHEVRHR